MKNKNLLLYTSIASILIAVFIVFINYKLNNKNDESKYLQSVNYNEVKKLIDDKETFILFIGSKTCHACKLFTPIFQEVLNEYNIYSKYIDLNDYSDAEKNRLTNLIKVESVPTVAFINEGSEISVINRIIGNIAKDKIIDKLRANDYIE